MEFTEASAGQGWGGVEVASGGDFSIGGASAVTAPVTVESGGQMSVEDDVTLDLGGDLTVESGGVLDIIIDDQLPNEVRFAPGARLVAEGTVDAGWARLTERDAGQGWGGVLVAGSFTTDDVFVEHATGAGVTVYSPGTVTLENSTLRENGTGLDVRSAAGTLVDNVDIYDNAGDGIVTGFIDCYGTACPCRNACRSGLTVEDSDIFSNDGMGIRALDATVRVERTVMSQNESIGFGTSNAFVNPFERNVIEHNEATGVAAVSSADLFMSPQTSGSGDDFGLNRVKNNDSFELYLSGGAFAFLGDTPGDQGNGRNSVYDDTGNGTPTLVKNTTSTTVEAVNTFWDTLNPAPRLSGPVDASNPLSCDYTQSGGCPFARPGGAQLAARTAAQRGALGGDLPSGGDPTVVGGLESLIGPLQTLRAAIAADPGSAEAAAQVYALGALHRRDNGDALGEWAATQAVLGALRATLAVPELPVAQRAAAEAALEVEALVVLMREDYAAADRLVAEWASHAEAPSVVRVLGLAEAHLAARAGRYAEAAELADAVAELEPEATGRDLVRMVAGGYAHRAGGTGGRGTSPLAGPDAARSATSEAVASLAVFPNPTVGDATLAVALPEPSHLRVSVFDVLGRRVALLSDELRDSGPHRFAFDGAVLPAGVYLVRAEVTAERGSGAEAFTERITLVR